MSSQPSICFEKDYIDYLINCSLDQLREEFRVFINEVKKASQCGSSWVLEPLMFSEAECPNTGEQRLVILGLMLIGICKNEWMYNRVKDSMVNCLERLTALQQEIETLFDSYIKGNGTTIADLAAGAICFHVCRIDPFGMNRRQLMDNPPPYLPDPRSFRPPPRRSRLDLDDE